VLLTLVALVFVKYILKHWWCSIDVPRLNPALVWVSYVPVFGLDADLDCTSYWRE
jgi:hypothetical protein